MALILTENQLYCRNPVWGSNFISPARYPCGNAIKLKIAPVRQANPGLAGYPFPAETFVMREDRIVGIASPSAKIIARRSIKERAKRNAQRGYFIIDY